MKEKKLYPVVSKWMKKNYGCFVTRINVGLKESRIDVVGVKDVGGDLSGEIEVISIEVKRGVEPFATAAGQASSYKIYAHRTYLADFRKDAFSDNEIAIAGHLGIGLIQIKNKKCHEILTSPYYKPMISKHLYLLLRLHLAQCQLCNNFFITKKGNNSLASIGTLKRAIKNEKGLIFWNFRVGERKHLKNNKVYEKRFLCPDCVQHLDEWIKSCKELS